MADNRTIYVVTDGDYSDYRIQGTFLDEAAAKRCCDLTGGDIEEWHDGQAVYPSRPDGRVLWRTRTYYKGVKHVYLVTDGAENVTGFSFPTLSWRGENNGVSLQRDVWAVDEKTARKSANDFRASLIAAGRWPDRDQKFEGFKGGHKFVPLDECVFVD